jgi:hypothetical protein
VRGARFQVDDEAEPARVVLEKRIIETLPGGKAGGDHAIPGY